MNPPLLKLEFVQGPRHGESIEFKSGSNLSLGRIIKGNKIQVKDKGISTKHLRIDSVAEKWIIQDLGSSNGTILNSESLEPDTPVELSHGDVIKLGEITSIVVSLVMVVVEEAPKLPPRPRRNNRRVADLDPKEEEVEVVKRPTRGSRSQAVKVEVKPRAGRARRNVAVTNVEEDEEEEEEEEEEVPEVKSRVSRARKNLAETSVVEEEEEEAQEVKSRVVRPRRNVKNVAVTNVVEEEEVPEVKSRVGRSRKNEKNVAQEEEEAQEVKSRVGRPRKNVAVANVAEEEEVPVEKSRVGRSQKNVAEEEVPEVKPRAGRLRKNVAEMSVVEEGEEEVPVEKSRVGRPRKNEKEVGETSSVVEEEEGEVCRGKKTASLQNLGLNSVKVEVEDTPKVVEVPVMNRARRGRKIENVVKCEETCLDDKGPSRATRSRRNAVGGDSFMELDRVLNQAKKSRANRKQVEQKPSSSSVVVEMEGVEEDEKEDEIPKKALNQARKSPAKRKQVEQKPTSSVVEMEVGNGDVEEDEKCCSEKSGKKEDEVPKRVEQVKSELREDEMDCRVREDGETENLLDKVDEERDRKSEEERDGACDEENVEQEIEKVKFQLRESTLGEEELNCSVRREDGEVQNLQDTVDEDSERKSEEEKVEEESSVKNVEKLVLRKMTARDWFASVDVQLVKQITEETEKLIEPMRNKALRVQKYIAEQLEAKRRQSSNRHG